MSRVTRVLFLLSVPVSTAVVEAQEPPPSWFRDTVTVVAGKHYEKGGIYRFFFGDHYRDLWTIPIRVPVLDLSRYAGGLKPTRKGGGQQTKSLRLDGQDGKQYQFRSVDKDPSAALPPGLRETFADRIFQDQISSAHPAGTLLVSPILDAAGVLHPVPVLAVMPDDASLGEFRSEFANLLGTIEERPRDAEGEDEVTFAGAKDVLSSEDFLKRVENNPDVRLDSREFLLARLTDVFLGDWDRHRDQWRWALMEREGKEYWHPIPRDRDQAFVRFDGLLLHFVRKQAPQLVKFGPKYSPIQAATWNGRDLDRRFLTDLEAPVWDSVARVLQGRLTDQAIEAAVEELPPEYQPIDGSRLRRALRSRRDLIPEMSRRYYELLSPNVDVHGSDKEDLAVATRSDSGVRVTLATKDKPDQPYYQRLFRRRETEDIRIYLQGAADSALVSGEGSNGIGVRVIGGGGDDRFVNQASGHVRFYDSRGENQAVGARIRTKPYQAIDDTTKPTAIPHRDWGKNTIHFPIVSYGVDPGFQVGVERRTVKYGFRKKPYSQEVHYRLRLASGTGIGKFAFDNRFQWENSASFWSVRGHVSGVESIRWYGFGNTTTVDESKPTEFYRVAEHEVLLEPSLGWTFKERVFFTIGPRFKYAVTTIDKGKNQTRFIAEDAPFGTGPFAQASFGAELLVDTRDLPMAPRKGVHLQLGGQVFPRLFDVTNAFGEIHGHFATYLSANIPTRPVLAFQAGGKKVFGVEGRIPFHEAAFLGSSTVLRGFQRYRFAGDGAVYGSTELRLQLTNLFLFVPGKQGVFGFVDGGRVYFSADPSTADKWHHTYGGGLWFSFVRPGALVTATAGSSEEGTRFYFKAGFAF